MGGDAGQGLKRTALYDRHVAAGAKLVGFGGWEMPLSYGSQIEEHLACRREAAMFDVSHMGQIEIAGGTRWRWCSSLCRRISRGWAMASRGGACC